MTTLKPAEDALLLRIGQAAQLCSISRSRAYRLAQRGQLPGAVRLAGTWRVNRRVLEAWADRAAAPVEPASNLAEEDEKAVPGSEPETADEPGNGDAAHSPTV